MNAPPAAQGCSRFGADPGELVARLQRTLPRPLVFTNGVFDILHAGHVVCLEEARRLGASLVVGINSDASARRLGKGPGRPFNTAEDRARVVAALAPVSAVVFFDEDKPLSLICALRPQVYVKGGDYTAERLAETALMAEWGGRTVIVPRHGELSTTGILDRARCPAHAARQVSAAGTACARAQV